MRLCSYIGLLLCICLFVFVCSLVVKLVESLLVNTLQIPVKFKCELCVCGSCVGRGGVLIYTCILGSLDKLGGVPTQYCSGRWSDTRFNVAIISIITRTTKVLAAAQRKTSRAPCAKPQDDRKKMWGACLKHISKFYFSQRCVEVRPLLWISSSSIRRPLPLTRGNNTQRNSPSCLQRERRELRARVAYQEGLSYTYAKILLAVSGSLFQSGN